MKLLGLARFEPKEQRPPDKARLGERPGLERGLTVGKAARQGSGGVV